jgi:hypothetical protein
MGFSLHNLTSRGRSRAVKWTIVSVLVIAIGVLAGAVLANSAPGVAVRPVSQAQLSERGITLTRPDGTPATSLGAARTLLLSMFPDATILDAALAEVTSRMVPRLDRCTCWVLSIIPKGGIHPISGGGSSIARQSQGTFMVVFVDSSNGKYVAAISGN